MTHQIGDLLLSVDRGLGQITDIENIPNKTFYIIKWFSNANSSRYDAVMVESYKGMLQRYRNGDPQWPRIDC